MDLSHRHLPWKVERQLRDLANQFRQQRLVSAWIRYAIVLVASLPALGLAIHLLSPTQVPLILPIGMFVLTAIVLYWRWIVKAQSEPTREQIALYIDEQHPELENLVISSLSFSENGNTNASAWLVDRFFEQARDTASATRIRDLVDHRQLKRQLFGLGGVWLIVALATVLTIGNWDFEWMRSQLFVRSGPAPTAFSVEPGNIRVRHGVDQVVWLTTQATSETVAIRWRSEDGAWISNALQPSRSENVYYHTFTDVQTPILYQIQSAGSQSPVYRIDVWTPPEVVWIDALYRYPDYSGLPEKPRTAISDLEGPVGTEVTLTIHTNQPVTDGQLTFAYGQPTLLEAAGPNTLTAHLEIGALDTFQVSLRDTQGEIYQDDRPYPINPEWDEVPEIAIQFPRGDDEATPLEEIPFAFKVQDDLGIWSYGIQFEIAGREPERRTLGQFDASQQKVEATDQLFLEDLNLKPGDFLTWSVWADDGHPGRDAFDQLSDPFFLEIRPFRRTYAEAVSNAGQQSGGQQGGSASDQKQVIIATWNLRKTAPSLVDGEFEERISAIITAQQDVLAAAFEGEAAAMMDADTMERLKSAADEAITSLSAATWEDSAKPLSEALRHEQIVHQILLSLVPDEQTLAQNEGRSRSGQSVRRNNRELDALELTRRRDFAEEATTQNERLGQTEEVRKGIEDLAKRQTFINQDLSELISEKENEKRETEEERRRLQRLIDEQRQNLSELEDLQSDVASGEMEREQGRNAQEGLSEAGRQMRRTLEHLEGNQTQRAQSTGSGALRELSEVESELGSLSQGEAAEQMADLADQMDALADQQQQILNDIRGHDREPTGLKSIEQNTEDTPIIEQKQELADAFESFMNKAGELAEMSEATQGLASRRLNDWLRETSRDGIYEDIERGKDLVRRGIWEAAENHETDILEKFQDAQQRLTEVRDGLVASETDGMRRALAQVEGLVSDGSGDPLADPGELSDFLEEDYRGWVDDLRTAESMLDENSDVRRDLTGVRENIDRLRRRYRRDKIPPRYDLIFDQVTKPLRLAAEVLRQDIAREMGEYAVGIERLEAVPERYRKDVAEYFKALSEIDVKGDR